MFALTSELTAIGGVILPKKQNSYPYDFPKVFGAIKAAGSNEIFYLL